MHEPIALDVALFESNSAPVVERSKIQLLTLLHGLTAFDRVYLSFNTASTPTLYTSGVEYETDSKPWRDVPRMLSEKRGNCKDFAAWRCAELRLAGVKCKPFILWNRREDGYWQFHAVVLRETIDNHLPEMKFTPKGKPTVYRSNGGWIEDPSRILGMGWNGL